MTQTKDIEHNGNYVRKDTMDVNGFKKLRLFIFEHALSVETDDENAWLIDLGAYAHMSYSREWYDGYHEKFDGTHIYLGDNRSHEVQGYGVISLNLLNGQLKHIHNVMYVPGIKNNLIYVSFIIENDMKEEFDKYKVSKIITGLNMSKIITRLQREDP